MEPEPRTAIHGYLFNRPLSHFRYHRAATPSAVRSVTFQVDNRINSNFITREASWFSGVRGESEDTSVGYLLGHERDAERRAIHLGTSKRPSISPLQSERTVVFTLEKFVSNLRTTGSNSALQAIAWRSLNCLANKRASSSGSSTTPTTLLDRLTPSPEK